MRRGRKFGLTVQQPTHTKCRDKHHCKQILFGILTHIFHSLVGYLNKSTNFLKISPRKIENIMSGGG